MNYLYLLNGTTAHSLTGGWGQMYWHSLIDADYAGGFYPAYIDGGNYSLSVTNPIDASIKFVRSFYTNNKINLANISKIYIKFAGYPTSTSFVSCNSDRNNNAGVNNKFFITSLPSSSTTMTIDVSSINNSCYLGITTASLPTNDPQYSLLYLHYIYVE